MLRCAAFVPPHFVAVQRGFAPRMAGSAGTGGAAVLVQNVDVWAGSTSLIRDVNWSVMPKERWALQGSNGCGKSTLLRAISAAAKGEKLGDGTLIVSSLLRFGMLEQTAVSGRDTTVRQEVMSRMYAANSSLNDPPTCPYTQPTHVCGHTQGAISGSTGSARFCS